MASVYMRVVYTDGREKVVRIGPKTYVAFERHFSKNAYHLTTGRTMEQTYWLPWHALHEVGEEEREFDDFLSVLEDVTAQRDTPDNPVDEQAVNPEPDPSQTAQPSGTSSS
jgi:hypothetical protein